MAAWGRVHTNFGRCSAVTMLLVFGDKSVVGWSSRDRMKRSSTIRLLPWWLQNLESPHTLASCNFLDEGGPGVAQWWRHCWLIGSHGLPSRASPWSFSSSKGGGGGEGGVGSISVLFVHFVYRTIVTQ